MGQILAQPSQYNVPSRKTDVPTVGTTNHGIDGVTVVLRRNGATMTKASETIQNTVVTGHACSSVRRDRQCSFLLYVRYNRPTPTKTVVLSASYASQRGRCRLGTTRTGGKGTDV